MELDDVDNPGRFFASLARDLKSIALSNVQFFQNGKQSHQAKFHMSFSLLYEYLDVGIEPSYRELSKHLNLYDFSPEVKGNGYRSLLHIVQKCCLHLLQLSRYISTVKDSMLFRKKYYAKELEAYVSALGQLRAILYYALKMINYCQDGELFVDEEKINSEVADHLMMEVESLNQECFYGRCLGFQFCESMQRPVQIMNIAMASYSEGYLETSGMMQVATSVFNSGKYFLDPELRATQLAKVTRTADIKFCKAFWSISESGLVQQLPSMVCPSVEVDEYFPLGPDAFELPLVDGSDTVVITPPCAHIGPGHVMVRLISSHLREGQDSLKKATKSKSPVVARPRTPGLIIHMHGGGFIAQSSKSHEIYLRDWARILEIPILSVDYSLAPELPFPRALEDCFYAYGWAVKNCLQLGSLGETIIMAGDSAGGNLAISTAMRAASFGIRKPDGILGVYPVTMARYLPSPARLISLLDPILPVGLVSRCLAAYAGINEEHPLASPSTQEFQSKVSLNSLQMQTVESSNNEWVIIGQDEDECLQINQRLEQSTSSMRSKNVTDSMEDSFSEELLSPSGENRKLLRSDTIESDEIEIFSQLQEAGNCVFPKEDKKETKPRKSGKAKEENQGAGVTKEFHKNSLVGIQETAKSVMEGAQSMLTSLSSYIPSRTSYTNDNAGMNSSTTTASPLQPLVNSRSNCSVVSDPVDPISTSQSVESELDNNSNSVDVKNGPSMLTPQNNTDHHSALLSGDDSDIDGGIDKSETAQLNLTDNANDNSSSTGTGKFDSSNSTQLSSAYFTTAISSPSPGSELLPSLPLDNADHNFDSISLTSDQIPDLDSSRPQLGVSPNVESIALSADSHSQELTIISPDGLSPPLPPTCSRSETADSQNKLVFPTVPLPSNSTDSQQVPNQVDSPTSIPSDPVTQNLQSPTLFPSLSPENEQLLQDAALPSDKDSSSDSVPTISPSRETSSSHPYTNIPPPKPPTDLNLKTTTLTNPVLSKSQLSPSPNQIFKETALDLDSADTDTMDAAIFKTSCLEFLGPPSSPPNQNTAALSTTDGEETKGANLVNDMFRNDSPPTLSGMFSPSPTESDGGRPHSFSYSNGLKMGMSPSDFKRQTFTPHSPINTMRKVLVVRNPYMSPLMADAELLEGLPPVCLVACHLDPLLDDSVMFAKKLKALNRPVEVHLIDDLPHGFLNFSLISQEAKRASQFCANKLLQMVNNPKL